MAKGGYTFKEIREMNGLQLQFIDHYQQKQDIELIEKLATILGVNWDLDVLERVQSNTPAPGSKVFIPLSLVIAPDLIERLKQGRKEGSVVQDETGTQKVHALDEVPENELPAFLQRPKRK